jgi:hypothetical protein
VQLVGGLGNQLFGYFAGLFVANKLGAELVLDCSMLKNNKHDASSIFDFNIELKKVPRNLGAEFVTLLTILLPGTKTLSRDLFRKLLSVHYSTEVGFDRELQNTTPGTSLIGYFQSHRYFSENPSINSDKPLTLKAPSTWFLDLQLEAEKTKPIVMHVRRGDYTLKINEDLGVLSSDYFIGAVEKARSESLAVDSEIWVFSDSIDEAKKDFGDDGKNFRYIKSPASSSAAETMMLMASGQANIISNSTFSYWGALLSGHDRVIAPADWYKSRTAPIDLIPPTWKRHDSAWVS